MDIIEKEFESIWENLDIKNHIVHHLSKKIHGKQALEKAQWFQKEIKKEIIDDIVKWYDLKKNYKDTIENQINADIMDRINGELVKIGVPLLMEFR